MNKLIAMLLTAGTVLGATLVSGCNTVEGAGRDVEAAGDKVQEVNCTSADKANDPACRK